MVEYASRLENLFSSEAYANICKDVFSPRLDYENNFYFFISKRIPTIECQSGSIHIYELFVRPHDQCTQYGI